MKHIELYKKYKLIYPPMMNPMFSKGNLWYTIIIAIAALLAGPLIKIKYQKSISFSLDYYIHQVEFFSIIVVPFVVFLFWANWRETLKRSYGYGWLGKFEVCGKRTSFLSHHLILSPGDNNKIKVERSLFEKTRIGDAIIIRRDAFGNILEMKRINNISNRLIKVSVNVSQKVFRPTSSLNLQDKYGPVV